MVMFKRKKNLSVNSSDSKEDHGNRFDCPESTGKCSPNEIYKLSWMEVSIAQLRVIKFKTVLTFQFSH